MNESEPLCFSCKHPLSLPDGPIGRTATCGHCDADIRCCLNCQFYDPDSYNECREPSAERVLDKDRANFCDFFRAGNPPGKESGDQKKDALKKLDDLFK